MAPVTVTAANVVPVSGYIYKDALASLAITAGKSVYLNSSSQWALADADAAATCTGTVGIAINDAATNQPCRVIISGSLGFGAVLLAGTVYVVSTTAGGIAPYGDLGSGDFTTILGVASTTSNLLVHPYASGFAFA